MIVSVPHLAVIILVSNEKVADKASKLFPEYDVISWLGGTNSLAKVNWLQLQDKKIVIWPNDDVQGQKEAKLIQTVLENSYAIDTEKLYLPSKNEGWNLLEPLPAGYKISDMKLLIQKGERECSEIMANKIADPLQNNSNVLSSDIKPSLYLNTKLPHENTRQLEPYKNLIKQQKEEQQIIDCNRDQR